MNNVDPTLTPLQTISQINYLLCGQYAVLNKTLRAVEVRCYDDKPESEYKLSSPDCGCLDGYMRNSANVCIKAADCVPVSNGSSSSRSEPVGKRIVLIICNAIVGVGYIMSYIAIMYTIVYFFRSQLSAKNWMVR
uniref:Uncharacterized protein n=1 Tax=Microplitis mediator bracovirus TaxID=1836595 RepID=A0A1D5APK2_9VIRU|nr:hypothetical protein A6F54_81 [Microplitis mediator bracovirus]